MGSKLIPCLLLAWEAFLLPAQAQPLLQSPSKEIKIADIRIEGNRTVDKSLIVKATAVEKGEAYIAPVLKNKIQASVTALDKLNLFSDIRMEQESADSLEGIVLYVVVAELPTLARVEYQGLDKLKADDFKGKVELVDGQVYSRGAVETARQKILDIYRDKGYLLAAAAV